MNTTGIITTIVRLDSTLERAATDAEMWAETRELAIYTITGIMLLVMI